MGISRWQICRIVYLPNSLDWHKCVCLYPWQLLKIIGRLIDKYISLLNTIFNWFYETFLIMSFPTFGAFCNISWITKVGRIMASNGLIESPLCTLMNVILSAYQLLYLQSFLRFCLFIIFRSRFFPNLEKKMYKPVAVHQRTPVVACTSQTNSSPTLWV